VRCNAAPISIGNFAAAIDRRMNSSDHPAKKK